MNPPNPNEAAPEGLLPCPFCGSVDLRTYCDSDALGSWYIHCSDCLAEVTRDVKSDAISAWNRRAPLPPTGEGVSVLDPSNAECRIAGQIHGLIFKEGVMNVSTMEIAAILFRERAALDASTHPALRAAEEALESAESALACWQKFYGPSHEVKNSEHIRQLVKTAHDKALPATSTALDLIRAARKGGKA